MFVGMILEDLAAQFGGLTEKEVAKRTSSGQTNRDPRSRTKAVGEIVAENLLTVFNVINAIIIGTLAWLFVANDDVRLLLDALGIFAVIIANTVVSIVQEVRAHRALERALLTMTPRANVIRNSQVVSIDREDVVRDDVLVIRRGDVLAADGEVLYTDGLELDESLLTGESHPTETAVGRIVHAATHCTAGVGVVRVVHVGSESMAARITAMAKRYSFTPSPMQRTVNRLFEGWFAFAVLIATIEVILSASTILQDVDEIRRIATLLVGLIPEGLVFFATITVTLSVVRISKKGVVVQKLAALESFASADVVCMDKTGTLTQNRLSVHGVEPLAETDIQECTMLLRAFANTSSDEGQTIEAIRSLEVVDSQGSTVNVPPLKTSARIAFSSARKYSALLLADATNTHPWIVLGAADVILTTSHPRWDEVMGRAATRGWDEMRLLMLARASTENHAPVLGTDVVPLCWCALDDTVRPDAKDALDLFADMGVRVIIMTGDAPGPVISALQQLGRKIEPSEIVLGPQLKSLDDAALTARVASGAVFARLLPDQKRDLVNALRANKYHTVMIGDGVNDLPAIKAADVGIAMEKAAPITKEIADIVLDKASFTSLPAMVGEGRAVMRTVLNVAKLFVGKNTILVFMSLVASAGWIPFPLTPRRGAFLSILGVGIPSMLLAAQGRLRSPVRSFYKELSVFVIVCSLCAIGLAWIAHALSMVMSEIAQIHAMTLTYAMAGSLLGSFVAVDLFDDLTKRHVRLLTAVLLLAALGIAACPAWVPVVNILQTFYEVQPVTLLQTLLLAAVSVGSLITSSSVHTMVRSWISSRT